MASTSDKDASRHLSYVLRHRPDSIGLALDPGGWADVDELVERSRTAGHAIDRERVTRIVETSDKRRFALSEDGTRIRANQGHSIEVDLGLAPLTPPAVLFHGTATRFLDAIRAEGLRPGSRRFVHLSADEATAVEVGRRHGEPVVLHVDAARMHADGGTFYVAENGVWLTERVDPDYLSAEATR